MNHILLVDDDRFVLKALRRALTQADYEVAAFDNPLEALEYAHDHPVELAIADYVMPQMNGVRFLIDLERRAPDVISIILSGTSDVKAVLDGYSKAHIYRYMVKPWDERELYTTVADALNHREFILAAHDHA